MLRVLGMVVVALIVLVAAAPRGPAGDAPAGNTLKLGLLKGMFRDVQPAMVQAIAKPLRSLIERQTGFTGDVEMYADAESLATKLDERKIQLGVFHGYEYAQIRAGHPELMPIVVTVPHSRFCQAVVVVHKDAKGEKLADLSAQPLAIPRGIKAYCLAYLEKARRGLPAATAQPTHKPTQTTEDLLNGVADGSISAALVDLGAYTGYQEYQPGAAKHIRVLCKSEVFPVTAVVYRKQSLSDESLTRIRKGLVGANQTAHGKPLMLLWNLKGFEDVPADYITQLDTILKAYPTPKVGNAVRSEK